MGMLNSEKYVVPSSVSGRWVCLIPRTVVPLCVSGRSVCLITARKRSCVKVLFLHLSVSHSVHRWVSASVHTGYTPWADTPLGRHPPGQTPHWADIPPVQCMLGYTDCTHPTGMHSCFENCSTFICLWKMRTLGLNSLMSLERRTSLWLEQESFNRLRKLFLRRFLTLFQ